jgi:hypothetical protein
MSQQPTNEALPLSAAEFHEYIVFHAHKLTRQDLTALVARLPTLRQEFDSVRPPEFPHTPVRLHFLADVVEEFVRGGCDNLPFESAAEAASPSSISIPRWI